VGLFNFNSVMSNKNIVIKGARTHNLKNLDLELKLNSITCICGPSGSGKSSLAFHTILTESKRRFMNSFPSDVKFFWDIPQSADVDEISPVLPVWGLSQSNPVLGSRPASIDLMGVNERISKILFVLGKNHCSIHDEEMEVKLSLDEVINFLDEQKLNSKDIVHIFMDHEDYSSIYGSGFFPSRSYDDGISEFSEEHVYWELFKFRYSSVSKLEKRFKDLGLEKLLLEFQKIKSVRNVKKSKR
jgi:excinuclease ABC subunit A